jgi:hypothetical protein
MAITNAFVDRPCTIILGGIFLLIILTALAVQLKYFEMEVPTDREYLVWNDPRTMAWDKQKAG